MQKYKQSIKMKYFIILSNHKKNFNNKPQHKYTDNKINLYYNVYQIHYQILFNIFIFHNSFISIIN